MESDDPRDCKPAESMRTLIHRAAQALKRAGVAEPQRDARRLMRWATGRDGAELIALESEPPSPEAAQRFEQGVAERRARRPVSQIVGGRAFFGRWFEVGEQVLDPRPESELLVSAALDHLPAKAAASVLDLGVGSGCLLISVLAERPAAEGVGVDASPEALEFAARNAASHDVAKRMELRLGDWLQGLDGRFDVILCNPPYISDAEWGHLAPELRRWEPRTALCPGGDALRIYRLLAPKICDRLRRGGVALFEIGRGQAGSVAALLGYAGMETSIERDLGQVERLVIARPRRNG